MSENKNGADGAAKSDAALEDKAAVEAVFAELSLKKKKKKKPKKDKKEKDKKRDKKRKKKREGSSSGEALEAAHVADLGATYSYGLLLQRVYDEMAERNPNFTEKKKYRMVPPEVVRIGPRTMWVNFPDICKLMKRKPEHVMQFALSELGTTGSVSEARLIFKGSFQQKNLESLLRKYIAEYVQCHMCKSPETRLERDPMSRLYILSCSSCGATRSVNVISKGFHKSTRAERRKAAASAGH